MAQTIEETNDQLLAASLDEEFDLDSREASMLSELALAEEWLTPEEDADWAHLAQLASV